jgi:hypothetical protein
MVSLDVGVGDGAAVGVGVDQQDLAAGGGPLEGEVQVTVVPCASWLSQVVPPALAGGTDGPEGPSEGFLCMSSGAGPGRRRSARSIRALRTEPRLIALACPAHAQAGQRPRRLKVAGAGCNQTGRPSVMLERFCGLGLAAEATVRPWSVASSDR